MDIPKNVFRGTYDIKLEIESECYWVQNIPVVAGDAETKLYDYIEAI